MAQAVEFVRKNAKIYKSILTVIPYRAPLPEQEWRRILALTAHRLLVPKKILNRTVSLCSTQDGHNDYNRQGEPATFVAIGEQDGIASPNTMKRGIEQLNAIGVPTEFHFYTNLGHGFALGTGTTAEGWEKQAVAFWQRQLK